MKSQSISKVETIIQGYKAGWLALSKGAINKESIRLSITPLNYWRMIEIPLVLSLLKTKKDSQVLNIASPFISSLILAKMGISVTTIDIQESTIRHQISISKAINLSSKIHPIPGDATSLKFNDNTFSNIYAISSIEHIPNNGDISAVQEIHRVLKPGGQAIISVPFTNGKIEAEFRQGSVYERSTQNGQTFFQRFYTDNSIQNRLVKNSALKLEQILFISEKNISNNPDHTLWFYLGRSNRFKNIFELFSPLVFPFLKGRVGDASNVDNPIIAVLIFKK